MPRQTCAIKSSIADVCLKVWSFSPPEEVLYESPQWSGVPNRPMSAVLPDYRAPPLLSGLSRREDVNDVDMVDVGPSTAPLQQGNTTFFHDD